MVLDSSKPLDSIDEELLKLTENKKRIILANKSDKPVVIDVKGMILLSTVDKTGLEELKNKLLEVTNIDTLNFDEGKYLANERQMDLMLKASRSLKQALDAEELGMDIDLIEIDVQQAFDYLGQITGEAYPEELITALFTKFCLGK